MPTKDEHSGQSIHNRDVSVLLAKCAGQALDWEVTTLFYSAVHMVEARMDDFPVVHYCKDRHQFRKDFVDFYFGQASRAFVSLYSKCRRARYDCIPLTQQDVDFAKKWHEAVRKVLVC